MIWRNLLSEPFEIYGLAVREKGRFYRMPEEQAEKVSPAVAEQAKRPAGARVRFRTDSGRIQVRYVVTELPLAGICVGILGKSGIDVYVDGRFCGNRVLSSETVRLEVSVSKEARMQDVEIVLPSHNILLDMDIGLEDTARLEPPRPYHLEKPIVFYGSSITHGGVASRQGMAYTLQIGRKLDADVLNLGFSGSARGEKAMAEYIAGLEMSAFVMEYDHNAPDAEFLKETHYPFYRIIREANPGLPVLMFSRPDALGDGTRAYREITKACTEVIRETYRRALAQGDTRVEFIDGLEFFGTDDADVCSTDTVHPNDLGMYRMAQRLIPVLRKMLGEGWENERK